MDRTTALDAALRTTLAAWWIGRRWRVRPRSGRAARRTGQAAPDELLAPRPGSLGAKQLGRPGLGLAGPAGRAGLIRKLQLAHQAAALREHADCCCMTIPGPRRNYW